MRVFLGQFLIFKVGKLRPKWGRKLLEVNQ